MFRNKKQVLSFSRDSLKDLQEDVYLGGSRKHGTWCKIPWMFNGS